MQDAIQDVNNGSRIYAYKIMTYDLVKALKVLNIRQGRGENLFASRVIQVDTGRHHTIVIVEEAGSYPYITREWEEVIIKEPRDDR